MVKNGTQFFLTVNSPFCSTQAGRAVHLKGVVPKMHLCPSRLRNDSPSLVTVNSLCCTSEARRAVHLQGDEPKMHRRPSRWLSITLWLSNPYFAGAAVGEEKGEKNKGVTTFCAM